MEDKIQSDRDIRCEFLNIFKFIRAACGIEPLGEIQNAPEPENTNSLSSTTGSNPKLTVRYN